MGEGLPDLVAATDSTLTNVHDGANCESTLPVVISHSTSCPLANPASNLFRILDTTYIYLEVLILVLFIVFYLVESELNAKLETAP